MRDSRAFCVKFTHSSERSGLNATDFPPLQPELKHVLNLATLNKIPSTKIK